MVVSFVCCVYKIIFQSLISSEQWNHITLGIRDLKFQIFIINVSQIIKNDKQIMILINFDDYIYKIYQLMKRRKRYFIQFTPKQYHYLLRIEKTQIFHRYLGRCRRVIVFGVRYCPRGDEILFCMNRFWVDILWIKIGTWLFCV